MPSVHEWLDAVEQVTRIVGRLLPMLLPFVKAKHQGNV